MRRMTKFVHGTAGSVSIFLLVIIFCFVSLGGLLIDGIRVRTAKQRLELATEAAADSVLAGYSNKLANEYGIFALTGEDKKSSSRAKDVIETYTSKVDNTFNLATLENVEVMLETGNKLYPVDNAAVLENQLLESSKYTGVYTLGKGILEALGFFEKNGATLESISDMVNKQDELKELIEERNKALKEVEKKTGEIKKLENKVEEKAADLEKNTLATRLAKSCLEEILVGSDTKGQGILKTNLAAFEAAKESYEAAAAAAADDEDYDGYYDDMVTVYENAIRFQEGLIEAVKQIDKDATDSVKDLKKTFVDESKKTNDVIEALDDVLENIELAKKKNDEIIKIVGELEATEETQEIMDGLENVMMKESDFQDMSKKITDVKTEYEGYRGNVKIIERNLKNVIGAIEKIGRPMLSYTNIGSLDLDSNVEAKLQNAYIKDMNNAIGYLVGEGLSSNFPQITGEFEAAVSAEKAHEFKNMTDAIEAVNKWAKEKEYIEDPGDELTNQEEQYQSNADESFTEMLDMINDIEGVATDQAVYNELLGIVNTMREISAEAAELDADSQEELYEKSNDLLGTLLDAVKSLGDKVLINEYLLNEVGSKQPKDLLEDLTGNMSYENKKLEFVIYGQYVSGTNYALSMGEIMLIRLLMNTIAALRDDFVSIFKPYPLLYLGVVLAYTIINTCDDLIILGNSDSQIRAKRAVELVPNFTDNLMGGKGIKWTYKDHMRFILLYHPRGGQYERLLAVIEKDTSVEGVANKPTQVKIESSAEVKLWFLPGITKALAGEGGGSVSPNELKLTTIKYASY